MEVVQQFWVDFCFFNSYLTTYAILFGDHVKLSVTRGKCSIANVSDEAVNLLENN